jgi:hypothetical protein
MPLVSFIKSMSTPVEVNFFPSALHLIELRLPELASKTDDSPNLRGKGLSDKIVFDLKVRSGTQLGRLKAMGFVCL